MVFPSSELAFYGKGTQSKGFIFAYKVADPFGALKCDVAIAIEIESDIIMKIIVIKAYAILFVSHEPVYG